MPKSEAEVLIVGAGPTGLSMALWLARAGVSVQILDKLAEPGTTSRAVGVAARTLELYRQLGIADEVVAEGWKTPAVNLWVRKERAAHITMSGMGEGETAYPFELMYPQGAHERLLIRALAAAGVEVERPRSLVRLARDTKGVTASLDDGSARRASYVVGCDGAHSMVREQLGIGLPGGTYAHRFFVADVDGGGRVMDGELHVSLDTSQFLAAFPLARGRARVIGTTGEQTQSFGDIEADVTQRLDLVVTKVRDFSAYRVHHRVADGFRRDRAFLCGDAAHLHSPAGAQGMNTGIGDGINLAWKMAAVLGGAPASLLDSFEPERRGFALKLVSTTDRLFQFATHEGQIAAFLRTRVAPHAMHAMIGVELTRRSAFRTIAQLEIAYHDSALSVGRAGDARGGDRLPWVAWTGGDNYAPLKRQWQIHVYGEAKPELSALALETVVFTWTKAMGEAGLAKDAAYLVRPDGYIGWADPHADVTKLREYAREHGISV